MCPSGKSVIFFTKKAPKKLSLWTDPNRFRLDKMDLADLDTKPFEPKLPLPEAFESDLVKSAISQLQPIINEYLSRKPLYLPESIAPLAASPQVWSLALFKFYYVYFLQMIFLSRKSEQEIGSQSGVPKGRP